LESGIGEAEGGVQYVEIEYDSPDLMTTDVGMRYMITKIPTLLSFDRGEPQGETRVTDGKKMVDKQFLKEWIETEAKRHGSGGAGGGSFGSGLLGGLFGGR
jgi:hypothetical protein